MDDVDELAYIKLKLAAAERQEKRVREALVIENGTAKRLRQAIEGSQVLLAPLRRLLVTLEADPRDVDFVEARDLVRRAVKILDDALDGT